MKDKYSNQELAALEKMSEDLIIWMFHKPNDSHPIKVMLKRAFDFGKEITQKTGK